MIWPGTPHEQTNLIGNPNYADAHGRLVELANAQWDMESLTREVSLSQRRRLFLRGALGQGKTHTWDYVAPDQVVDACLRGKNVYNEWAYNDVLGLKDGESG
ncbi:MAG: hypothetical protein GKR95_11285 [Gammaproteobacteria bacterium]|nr:hypothetical protein [Gammaproteobacteria bacterium]